MLDMSRSIGASEGVPRMLAPVSTFRAPQMQAYFWYQAHQLGAYARVEAGLPGAGVADLLITRDLLATEPLIVVEFKERLESGRAVGVAVGQVRRYQAHIKRKCGTIPVAFVAAPKVGAKLHGEYRSRSAPGRVVRVTDALGLQAALIDLLRAAS